MPRPYKHAMVSLTPVIQLTGDGERSLETLSNFHQRYLEGQKLVVLEATTLVMRMLRRLGPDIDDFSYRKDMRAVFTLDDRTGEVIASIIGEQSERPADLSTYEIAYMYTKRTLSPAAQKWYEVLRSYQPFPVSLYPMPTGLKEAVGLIVRRVSSAAYADEVARIKGKVPEIERRMAIAGAPVTIGESTDTRTVATDLAFAILQVEYGLGRKAEAHWRPALDALKGELGILGDKFKRYMATGKASVFEVDNSIAEVSNIPELSTRLQERLAKSAGLTIQNL